MISRRKVIFTAPAVVAGVPSLAMPQTRFPDRPIRIVVSNSAGGTDDAISRTVAAKLAAEFWQSVIVENRGGGSQTIGGAHVAHAASDAYTLLWLISAGITQTVLRDKLFYSLNSFAPVVGVGGGPLAVAGSATASTKITSMDELIAAAKGPNGITFASGGVGSMAHLNTTRFLKAVGGKGIHVAYENNPESLQALIGGYTQLMFSSVSEVGALRGDHREHRISCGAAAQRAGPHCLRGVQGGRGEPGARARRGTGPRDPCEHGVPWSGRYAHGRGIPANVGNYAFKRVAEPAEIAPRHPFSDELGILVCHGGNFGRGWWSLVSLISTSAHAHRPRQRWQGRGLHPYWGCPTPMWGKAWPLWSTSGQPISRVLLPQPRTARFG